MKIKRLIFGSVLKTVENGTFSPDSMGVLKRVISITEHSAQGEGDKWYWDVVYTDKTMTRYFNVDSVDYELSDEDEEIF